MLKQLFSKALPRKSTKADTGESNGNGGNGGGGGGDVGPGRSLSVVKRMSSAVFPSNAGSGNGNVSGMDGGLSFKDVPNADKQSLLISKLRLCCVVFDFHDSSMDTGQRDLKRQTLIELVEFIGSGSTKLNESVIAAVTNMATVNLFRVFPPNYRSDGSGGDADDDEPMFEPAWSHLQVVYDLFLRFITSTTLEAKVAKKYIDHSFILKLLELFDSEDPRERECLKTILHRIYGKFMVHRPFIRNAVSNIFYQFVFETERHNGIAELLEIFGSVISGFALPLKEEHKMFLWRALIPLHKPKSVGNYLQQLSYCITQFVEKDPKLASSVVKGLLKYWPVTNSQKEVMFLGELEEVLEMTNMAEFQKNMIPLFRRIGSCLNNSHFQVAERALLFWNNDHIVSLIANNRQALLPHIYPALEWNTRNHWNQTVLNLTLNIKKMFSEMDNDLVLFCQKKFEEEEANQSVVTEKRRSNWERLENVASTQPVSVNTAPTTAFVMC